MKALTLVLAMLVTASANAMTVGDAEIPDSYAIPGSETTLVLNGAGIREKFFMDIYVGALYLPVATPDAAAILGDEGPASVLMHFLHKEVSKEKINAGWRDGLADNTTAEQFAALEERLEEFSSLFRTVARGDDIRIDYLPGDGTQVRINGEWRGSVEGNDFFRALLSVWLGNSPASKGLRRAMLGEP